MQDDIDKLSSSKYRYSFLTTLETSLIEYISRYATSKALWLSPFSKKSLVISFFENSNIFQSRLH